MNKAENLYERIKNPDVDDNILELYIRYIRTNKRDRPIKMERYGEDPPEDIKNALIKTGKRTKEGKWTKEAIDELNEWKEIYEIDTDVLDVKQLGGRRRKKKSRRTKKKKRRRTKKKRRRTKKKRRKRRTRRKRGGVGDGKKCTTDWGDKGRMRGDPQECTSAPSKSGHSKCYFSSFGNDCKLKGTGYHCIGGTCKKTRED